MKSLHSVGVFLLATCVQLQAGDLGGATVKVDGSDHVATLSAELTGPFTLQVHVNPKTETKPLSVRVELPSSGPKAWPAADVEVRDGHGNPLTVQRTGIEWFKMLIPLRNGTTSCIIQAVEPAGGWPKMAAEKDRMIQDTISGVKIRIAKWHDGRSAALSIRFDDSHPTHLTKAVPILQEHGFRGTFMLNPGASESGSRRHSDFEQHQVEWETVAKLGTHELANHSAHHRGGFGDEDMEAEIGDAARAIWNLTPGKSPLMALNLGGGTRWDTTKNLRYYLDKYHLFDASENSTGMDDSYGNRVENFRRILEQHIQRGLWCRIHYHYIGEGLSSSEANFRAALDIAQEHAASLWIAGMADIYKYQTERNSAQIKVVKSDPRSLYFQFTCTTKVLLYDQPLTIEVLLPPQWNAEKVIVKDASQHSLTTRPCKIDGGDALRFDIPPKEVVYAIELVP